jgi:hypothetical protein
VSHFGVTIRPVSTRFVRIPVTKDPPLADALDRVKSLEEGKPMATLVHDLAIRGANALVEERRERNDLLAWVAEVTTSTESLWDEDVLERIDKLAWGADSEPR